MPHIEFGIFDHVERRDETPSETYRSHLKMVALADHLDFYCYHLAEHHGTGLSLAPSPSTFLAAVAVSTSRIRLGSLVYLLPMHNPLRLAEEIAMLDHLSDGRLELGVGRGASPIELDFFGVDVAESAAHFEEAFDVIMRAIVDGYVDHRSDRYEFRKAKLELGPLQLPHPPIWYPSSGTARLPWAAGNGYHTILNGQLDQVANQVEIYRSAVPDGGDPKIGITRYVVLGETVSEAAALATRAYEVHRANLLQLARERNLVANSPAIPPESVRQARADGWLLVGTPEQVGDQIAHVLDVTGCNYFAFAPLLGDLALEHTLRSLQRFSSEVIPRVRGLHDAAKH